MPVIISRDSYGLWLDKSVQEPRFLKTLFEPAAGLSLRIYKVGFKVNNPTFESEEIIRPVV
ncbi:hypothetical protein, partial [Desulfonatronospira sp.]|uniref:hypothetical protein n=1 Tax=Desulfonatronospira sp. TaxID=1962951 RepID=UPI0025C3B43F